MGEKMKVVYAYVVGDILHTGHLLHLRNAKALGDKLIVGVLTDSAVMEKKPKPINSFTERLQVIQTLGCVDCAVTQDTYSPLGNVLDIKPDIMVESTSHDKKDIETIKEAVKTYGGKVVVLPYYPSISSTQIKEKIKNG